jgi:L-threonylcarbamoyladenylate synthase
VARATELLRAGEVVALPTETVYGLAANALDGAAVARLFKAKGRPPTNPVIVHVASLVMARHCVRQWPAAAGRLAAAFWPGPLTLVLPKAPAIPSVVTAGGGTVGVRWPSHPFIQAVIQACGFPLAAPSANPSSRLSPTTAEHVRQHLGHKIPLIVDGGTAQIGIESTVLDLTASPPRVLRPGMIHEESLRAVLPNNGPRQASRRLRTNPSALRSPGQLPKHYAPLARLVVMAWADEADLRTQLRHRSLRPLTLTPPPGGRASSSRRPLAPYVIAHTHIPSARGLGGVSILPHEPGAYAQALYAELHRCDEAGARMVVVEAVPDTAPWRAIRDRLHRAAAG